MKKYKLIKEYPNSPNLGDIGDFGPDDEGELCLTCKSIPHNWHTYYMNPTHFSEFWEEVVEKESDKPLFTTEDGVDIYKGDTIYNIWDGRTATKIKATKYHRGPSVNEWWLNFSTKKAAEEYLLHHKKCLSFIDFEIFIKYGYTKNEVLKYIKNRI